MYRTLLLGFCLIVSTQSFATIYKWVDKNGNVSFGQTRPADKSIVTQEISVKSTRVVVTEKKQVSLKISEDELIKANSEREAARDKTLQAKAAKKIAQERCDGAKKALAQLDVGGNRLYKDSEGNYSRLDEEKRSQQRQGLNTFIDKNCR
ncbi:MAG: DUF4124 domain-containing protein [Porticoccaceae bacterium]|nr:DUF4124 domain-containing protein [Porticoccaceae bacterium]